MKIWRIAKDNASELISKPETLDEKYLELLRLRDWKIASQMVVEEARKKGYNFGPVHHGSNSSFTKFDLGFSGKTDDGYFGRGFYFSLSKEGASEYGRVHTFYLSISNSLSLPESAIMGHSSLIHARDILGRVMDRPDVIPDTQLPKGYSVKKHKEEQWGKETGREVYSVYPNEELYGTPNEIYGEDMLTHEEAIVSFTDQLRDVSWNSGWLFGLTKDLGRNKMMDAIKAKGYDSIKIVDADSNNISEIVLWKPSRIKLIATKTIDDTGNIIPLSSRFNSSNDDFRY